MDKEIIEAVKNIKSAILKSQSQIALNGNRIQLSLYFGIGKYISENTRNNYWGTSAIENISTQLQKEMPGLRGFSTTNLKNMRSFFEKWNDELDLQSLTDDLQQPYRDYWRVINNGKNHLTIHQKCTILNIRKPCTPLVTRSGFNAHPARFFFCPNMISALLGWQR